MKNLQFLNFVDELNKPRLLRKGFTKKRKSKFSISDERINDIYDTYFSPIIIKENKFTTRVSENDFDEILYLLRVYFKVWVEIDNREITIYQDFPERFKIIKEVNKENHWFTPKTISIGTIMHFSKDHYGIVNFMNGLPMSETASPKSSLVLTPILQINYSFIKPMYN
ncbi:hypothetical protein [Sediminicola arcticus]|uniref:Uncharacterized protein n=1 Tax=Sediminicola arcticus TaxID=1574308 RepID=A0ABV2SPU4_9FLAO